jgi:hypothetical protein
MAQDLFTDWVIISACGNVLGSDDLSELGQKISWMCGLTKVSYVCNSKVTFDCSVGSGLSNI